MITKENIEKLTRSHQPIIFQCQPCTRGGGLGTFLSHIFNRTKAESNQLQQKAQDTHAEISDHTEKLKKRARKSAEQELIELEQEARRMMDEYEKAAQAKAAELEKVARSKAAEYSTIAQAKSAEYETMARKSALKVAAEWEKAARKRAAEYEGVWKQKATELEKKSRQRAGQLEKRYSKQVATAMGNPTSLLSAPVAKSLLVLMVIFMISIAISTLLGIPTVMLDYWKTSGNKLIPFSELTIDQKRTVAGILELTSAGLMMHGKKTRKFGAGLVGTFFTWATIVNMELDTAWQMVVSICAAFVAWVLLANEILKY